jgi:hypothetical protein
MIADIQAKIADFQDAVKDELTARDLAGLHKINFELDRLVDINPKKKSKKATLKSADSDSTE